MAVITEVRFRPDSSTSHANYSPSRNPDMNVAETTKYDGITVSQSYGGKIYTNERYGKQLEYELSYTNLSEADKSKLEVLVNQVKGRKLAFQFSADGGSSYIDVRFTANDLKFTQTAYSIYSTTFTIRQEI